MKHQKEVWKWKFKLIFPFCPGLGWGEFSYGSTNFFFSFIYQFQLVHMSLFFHPTSMISNDCTRNFNPRKTGFSQKMHPLCKWNSYNSPIKTTKISIDCRKRGSPIWMHSNWLVSCNYQLTLSKQDILRVP